MRNLQVVRVTPGRSRPPRSRFGLVFQTRPRLVLRKLSISLFRQPGHALEPLASGRLYTSPKRKRGGPRESSQEDRRRRIERPQGCPRHSRPIPTPSLALRAGIPQPPAGSSALHTLHTSPKRKRGGPRESSQEDRRRRIERPPGCPRHSRPIRTPSLALRAGIPDPTTTVLRKLSISLFRQPGHALETLASRRLYTSPKRKRGGLRESSQEDRRRRIERPQGCPRHSRPIRTPSLALRAGIPDPTTLGCVTLWHTLHTSPKRKRGGLRESSQEDRRRRIERPPCCPRHSRPIRTPSLALRAGISDPTTRVLRNSNSYSAAWQLGTLASRRLYTSPKRKRGGLRELAGTQAPRH